MAPTGDSAQDFAGVEHQNALAAQPLDERQIRGVLNHGLLNGIRPGELLGVDAGLDWRGHEDEGDSLRGELAVELENGPTRIGFRKSSPLRGGGHSPADHVGFQEAAAVRYSRSDL